MFQRRHVLIAGATAGLVDPTQAPKGAMIGAALPGVTNIAGVAGKAVGSDEVIGRSGDV